MDKKLNSVARTLASIKLEIKQASEYLTSLEDNIFLKQKELSKIVTDISNLKKDRLNIVDLSADVLLQNTQSIKDVVSRRNQILADIKQLEQARLIAEMEIEAKKNTKVELPNIQLYKQIADEIAKKIDQLSSQTENLESQKQTILAEIDQLLQVEKDTYLSIESGLETKELLESELGSIEEHRSAVLQSLAREQTKVKAMQNYERDIRAMHKQLTEKFTEVYKDVSSRSNINI